MELDQLRQFLHQSVQTMAEYTFPYTVSIVGIVNEEEGEHLGSGLRYMYGGRRAFATAYHVIEKARSSQYQGFAISTGYGRPPFQILEEPIFDLTADLALCFLPEDYPEHYGIRYWPAHRIDAEISDTENSLLATDYLFMQGFPGEKSQFSRIFDGLSNKSLPYGAMQRRDGTSNLSAFQFAIDYQSTSMRDREGNQLFINPHGMSGSPVWRIGISGRPLSEWSVADSLLVGFLTRWGDQDERLIATKASRILQMSGQ